MGKTGLAVFIILAAVACRKKQDDCNLVNDHSEGREWFAGTYSDTVIRAYTSDSLQAIFEFTKDVYDYMDYTVCPIEKWPGGIELNYASNVYDETMYFKVFNFHERTKVEIGVTNDGFTFYSFYPDELKLYVWNDYRGHYVEFVGDATIRGKKYADIYKINIPGEQGTLKYLLFSKHSGLIEFSSMRNNTWLLQ